MKHFFVYVVVVLLCLLFVSPPSLSAQPGCSPISLPYYEDFENGFVLNNGWFNATYLDTPYVLVDNCWLQCRKHECGWNSMCSFEYYFPGPTRNVYLRFGQRYKNYASGSSPTVAISSTPVLATSPSGISFKACYYYGMSGPNGDSTSAGVQMLVGYTVQDEPLQIVPNPHHDGIDYVSTSWDPLPYMVVNYDPDDHFVPIDTITVYSMSYLHYDVCRSNFVCKGITVPPNSRLVFKSCMPDSVQVVFQLDSLTIYGDYMEPDITVDYRDTVCSGEHYEGYGFSLGYQSPGTHVYTRWECTENATILHRLTIVAKSQSFQQITAYIFPGESYQYEDSVFTQPGYYTFTYPAANGCDSVIQIHVLYDMSAIDKCQMWVPNAFTPDGDGINDLFQPVFACPDFLEYYNLSIFDRVGSTIFYSTDLDKGWDADRVPIGCYPYLICYKVLGARKEELRGTVTVVR
ncbi:MAG: gliding motility-associated C-terminal domain-containing protein [Bacteroidales bacterium]|nr:gliding motility-associated C-terminal domain-containing protein [Bacteroidales bacterium]